MLKPYIIFTHHGLDKCLFGNFIGPYVMTVYSVIRMSFMICPVRQIDTNIDR